VYAVVGGGLVSPREVVEELLTRVTGDEIAFVVPDPGAVEAYRSSRNVDVREVADGDAAALHRALADVEVVLLLGPTEAELAAARAGEAERIVLVAPSGGPTGDAAVAASLLGRPGVPVTVVHHGPVVERPGGPESAQRARTPGRHTAGPHTGELRPIADGDLVGALVTVLVDPRPGDGRHVRLQGAEPR